MSHDHKDHHLILLRLSNFLNGDYLLIGLEFPTIYGRPISLCHKLLIADGDLQSVPRSRGYGFHRHN